MLALAATCLVVALAAPTAGAASAGKSKATAAKTTKAKAAITKKRLAKNIASANRKANAANRSVRSLRTALTTLGTDLRAAFAAGDQTIDGKINGIVGVVTPILTDLGNGLIALRDGSLALKAGLETLAAKTTEGFDLVKAGITTVATSQEYGVTGVFLTFDPGTGEVTGPGPKLGSPDVPDDGNSVVAGGTVPIIISGSPNFSTTFPAGTRVSLRSAIRSGEAGDGDATGDEAGQVGGLLLVKDASNATGASAAGTIICSVGPQASNNYAYDPPGAGAPTTLPLVGIQEDADRTDQSRPNATDTNPLANVADNPSTPLDNGTEGSCTLPAAGVYEVVVQTQYVDLPTSETPDADD